MTGTGLSLLPKVLPAAMIAEKVSPTILEPGGTYMVLVTLYTPDGVSIITSNA